MIVRRRLMVAKDSDSKFFQSLQERSSVDSYGEFLSRLVCFFLRLNNYDTPHPIADWIVKFCGSPTRTEANVLIALKECFEDSEVDIESKDVIGKFEDVLEVLFFKCEERLNLGDIQFITQLFLVVASLRKDASGFIPVREISRLISMLQWFIRATVFNTLLDIEDGHFEQQLNL
jgi:hypothetical protein